MAGETDSFEKHVTVEAGGAVGVFPRRHALFAGGVTLSAASLFQVGMGGLGTFLHAFPFVQESGSMTTKAIDELRPFAREAGGVALGANSTLDVIQELPGTAFELGAPFRSDFPAFGTAGAIFSLRPQAGQASRGNLRTRQTLAIGGVESAITVLNADGSVLQESPWRTGYAFVESPSRAGTARRVAGATLPGTAALSAAARRRQVQISPWVAIGGGTRKTRGSIQAKAI